MMERVKFFLAAMLAALGLMLAATSSVSAAPLRIEITEGVIEPVPFAVPGFAAESTGAEEWGARLAQVVADDLTGTGLFRQIPASAFISRPTSFAAPVQYADWKAINAQALIGPAIDFVYGFSPSARQHSKTGL